MTTDHRRTPDRAAAMEPLVRGEVTFRLLVEAVQDYAIFLLSTEGTVLTWNRGAERIKGYRAEEIVGKHFSTFYTSEEREAGRPMRLLGLAAENGRVEDEGWRVRKDGTRFWADVILTVLTDDAGVPYAFAKITRDMTERRAAEERRRQLLAEQRARAAAEEALVARDRFLSIAAHELKTPVATLRLGAESLLRAHDKGKLDGARLDIGLERISTSTQRLASLVDELLDVSRLSAESLPYQIAPTDLVPLAAEVIGRFADSDGGNRIRLVAPERVVIEADASRLDQVLTNLLDNALKYSEENTEVEVQIHDHDDAVDLLVADRGMGIDEVATEHMFEAFGRGRGVEHVPGLGLGLHIVSQIVSRHGGRIHATGREEGPGAVFSVRLPRHPGSGR